jgi:large subunit ribosomal protein LP0
MPSRERKEEYFVKLKSLLDEHTSCFIVHADHVRSRQFQDIRIALRGKAVVCMGKNTMMRKCMTEWLVDHPESGFGKVKELIRGNVGIIFMKESPAVCKEIVLKYTVPAPAKAGIEANCDVTVPAGPTGCDPSMTSYFQALNVPTKISKGQIEITSDIPLIKCGDRVTPGAASLLNKLDIKPFTFGLVILNVYDNGAVFSPEVLDYTDDIIAGKFCRGLNNIAAISLEIGYPTLASLPHSLTNAMKWCTAAIVGAESSYTFEKAEMALAYLADPSAFATADTGAAAGGAEEKKEEEEEEEEEEVALGGLMGGGDDDAAW